MEYRELGQRVLWFPASVLVPSRLGHCRGTCHHKKGAVIRRALAGGVNFIDTAQLYRSYAHIREAVKGLERPEDVIIATKSYDFTRDGMAASLEEARRELDLDVIPIFLLHEQESEHTLRGHRPALDYLLEAKAGDCEGSRHSTHHIQGVLAAAECLGSM